MEFQELLDFALKVQDVTEMPKADPIIQTIKTFGVRTRVVEIKEGEKTEGLKDACETCRACGHWPGHEGDPFCFHSAVFLGKSGNPKSIKEARKRCPRGEEI